MKFRQGYVSNSSSASFVVEVKKDFFHGNEMLLNKEQIELLENIGFKYVSGYPINIINSTSIEEEKECVSIGDINPNEPVCMIYWVLCNEEDVIDPCIEHHIPFYALINYDAWFYVYDGESDYYEIYPNYPQLYPYDKRKEIRGVFYKDELVNDGYKRVYFNKKDKKLTYEGIEDLRFTIEHLQEQAEKTFTQEEIKKINDFLFATFKERALIRKKIAKL